MSSLKTLHVDVLVLISSLVDAADIASLWISGDKLLNTHLCQGGVRSFRLINPTLFPRLVAHFRGLKIFHLELDVKLMNLQTEMYDADLSLLSPGLEELSLLFDNALHMLSLANPLSQRFPHLTSLELPKFHRNDPKHLDVRFLKNLPNTLRHLRLPSDISIDLNTILSLPCRLVSLHVKVPITTAIQEQQFRETKVFEDLTTLELINVDAAWPRIVPPSVTVYTWQNLSIQLAKSAVVTSDDLRKLPPHLRSLSVSWWPVADLSLLATLPSGLKCLKILYDIWTDYSLGKLSDDFVKFLPPNLTELHTPDVHPNLASPTAQLPKSLTKWPAYLLKKPWKRQPRLPETWRKMRIQYAEDADVFHIGPKKAIHRLPAALQKLTLECSPDLTSAALAKLPTTLNSLKLINFYLPDQSVPPVLPSSLTWLDIRIAELAPSHPADTWRQVWPPKLRKLAFTYRDRDAPLPPTFWASFVHLPLEYLDITLRNFGNLPPTLGFLPKTITSVTLMQEVHDDEVKANDRFLSYLPPSLTYLTLYNFSEIKSEVRQSLRKSFRLANETF